MSTPVHWLRLRAENVLRRAGLSPEEAHRVVDALIEADLRGRATHGLIRLPTILERLQRMERREVRIEVDRASAVLVDGGNELGYLVSEYCTRLAIERARKHGLALVAARDTTHAGMLGYFAERIARADLIGICCANCLPRTAPFGACEAVFGTNPIAVAVPTGGDPILLDFATSAVTIGDLLVAEREGKTLPEGLAFDESGRPTTDPEAARRGALRAFGGHKGSGLALIVQILTTAFIGAPILPPPGRDYGYFTLALDSSLFVSREGFRSALARLIERVRSARPERGVSEVLLPGERSFRNRRRTLETGLELPADILQLLAGAEPEGEREENGGESG